MHDGRTVAWANDDGEWHERWHERLQTQSRHREELTVDHPMECIYIYMLVPMAQQAADDDDDEDEDDEDDNEIHDTAAATTKCD